MVIDIRCRYLSKESIGYFAKSGSKLKPHENAASYVAMLDNAGIDAALSPVAPNHGLKLGRFDLAPRIECNGQQATMQKEWPHRFIGVAGIDPGEGISQSLANIEHCFNILGLKIVTMEPGRNDFLAPNPADLRLYPIYSYLQEKELPIILQTSGLKGGASIDYANPRWIDKIAHDFPALKIICAHGCFPFARELACVIGRRSNVFASPDCYTFSDFSVWRAVAEDRPDQLIFASGYPFSGPLKYFILEYIAAPWNAKFIDRMMYKNAICALQLEEDEHFHARLDMSNTLGFSERYHARFVLLKHFVRNKRFGKALALRKFWARG